MYAIYSKMSPYGEAAIDGHRVEEVRHTIFLGMILDN